MAKNERIIAQDLAEIKYVIQTHDSSKINELCHILARDIKKYPVKPNIVDRLEIIFDYHDESYSVKPTEENIKEINELIELLISSK